MFKDKLHTKSPGFFGKPLASNLFEQNKQQVAYRILSQLIYYSEKIDSGEIDLETYNEIVNNLASQWATLQVEPFVEHYIDTGINRIIVKLDETFQALLYQNLNYNYNLSNVFK